MGWRLQPWTTISASANLGGGTTSLGTITQDEDDWLDLAAYSNVAFWVDVTSVTGTPQLSLQTSPTYDDAYFTPLAPPLSLSVGATPVVVKSFRGVGSTAPLARYVRWQLTNSTTVPWGATFRVRAVPRRRALAFFAPTQLQGCCLWLRADMGVTVGGSGVSNWNDQSGAGDANRNLVSGPLGVPLYTASDSSFNGYPTLGFQSANKRALVSYGTWATAYSQPTTWVFVVNNTGPGTTTDILCDGNTGGNFANQVSLVATTNVLTLAAGAAGYATTSGVSWGNPTGLLAEFNGSSSNIYFNNFTTATAASGNTGTYQVNSMTLGAHSIFWGGGNYWDGKLGEVILYNRLLTAPEKARLRAYLNTRYALNIT